MDQSTMTVKVPGRAQLLERLTRPKFGPNEDNVLKQGNALAVSLCSPDIDHGVELMVETVAELITDGVLAECEVQPTRAFYFTVTDQIVEAIFGYGEGGHEARQAVKAMIRKQARRLAWQPPDHTDVLRTIRSGSGSRLVFGS